MFRSSEDSSPTVVGSQELRDSGICCICFGRDGIHQTWGHRLDVGIRTGFCTTSCARYELRSMVLESQQDMAPT